jgi:hypothetical protein
MHADLVMLSFTTCLLGAVLWTIRRTRQASEARRRKLRWDSSHAIGAIVYQLQDRAQ